LLGKSDGNSLLRWEDNIKTELTELGCKDVNLPELNMEAMHILLYITKRCFLN
jgi:hypothetical protein